MNKSVQTFISTLLLLVGISLGSSLQAQTPYDTLPILQPTEAHAKQAMISVNILNNYHYRKTQLNGDRAKDVFNSYLKALDNGKLYFQQADLEVFERYKGRITEDINRGNLEAPYVIFEIFRRRFFDRMDYLEQLLDQGFDFTKDESFDTDYENHDFAASMEEWNEKWRAYMKFQALNLMLAGRDYEAAKEVLKKRYANVKRNIIQYRSEDVFQLFMNAYSENFDPHTSYFSPVTAERFRQNMSLSFEGIGARLVQEDEYTKIVEVIAGGPAFSSKKLKTDDLIVGVAQGEDGEIEDVVGWRLDDVVDLIKGPAGTKVKLKVIPGEGGLNAPPFELVLARDKIKLEDEAARYELFQVNRNGRDLKIGVINIPSFYMDFEGFSKGDPDYRSTTRDVRRIIEELKQQGTDAIMIDLRRNGGGALVEAVQLSGLFVNKGPIVQVRQSNGSVKLEEDREAGLAWDGPLGVLIDRFSASASEIFAGAIQDYKRGVILGETTFGKGSVQNVVDLRNFLPQEEDELGQLKFTLAMYYRVNGESTQLKGVAPDIEFPSMIPADEFGESSQPNAMPWNKIEAARFQPEGKIDTNLLNNLNSYYQQRTKTDQELVNLMEEIEELRLEREQTSISLNLEKRKDQMELAKKAREERNKLSETSAFGNEIKVVGDKEPDTKDIYLKEGVMIMSEMALIKVG